MKKELFALTLAVFMVCFIIPAVSAEIILSQPKNLYNGGDELEIKATLIPIADSNDFLTANLVCDSGSRELYRAPFSIKSLEQKEVSILAQLDSKVIGELRGLCYVHVFYNGEEADSQQFEISDKIIVFIDVPGFLFDPSANAIITGNAKKVNGNNLNGFVKISAGDLNISTSGSVIDGLFNASLVIPQNAIAGTYEISAIVYEKDSAGAEINQGNALTSIRIRQIVKEIDIALDSGSVMPGNEITYTAVLSDQSGNNAKQDAGITIYRPDGSIFVKELIKAGETHVFKTETNFTPGYWSIEAYFDKFQTKKQFYVEELENISFVLSNDTLTIMNSGNVPYNKPVKVTIGDTNEIKEISLGVGASKQFKLLAPDGNYPVEISDGKNSANFGTAFLTGNAIGIKDLESLISGSSLYWIWAIIIVILLIIVLLLYKKIAKRKYIGKTPAFRPVFKTNIINTSAKAPVTDKNSITEEGGTKDLSAVISLKIKNLPELDIKNSPALDSISAAIEKAKDSKARVYIDGDCRIIILSPRITKESDNSLSAVRLAEDIKEKLNRHNEKYAQKIEFGIGINLGELITEKIGGVYKFTSWGNTIPLAKTISAFSNRDVLVSESLRGKVLGKVRAEQLKEKNFWRITNIHKSNSNSSEFISRFMKKQGYKADKKI